MAALIQKSLTQQGVKRQVRCVTRTCVDQDVSLQVVATPECPVTVITDEVFLNFGRWAILVSTRALKRAAQKNT